MKPFKGLLIFLLTVTVINYPNPFNPKGGEMVTFEATSSSTLETIFSLYDLSARRLLQKSFNLAGGGASRLTWNGYSDANDLAGNGVYLYRLIDSATKKLVGKGKVWVINH
jgi:hypothetical protein